MHQVKGRCLVAVRADLADSFAATVKIVRRRLWCGARGAHPVIHEVSSVMMGKTEQETTSLGLQLPVQSELGAVARVSALGSAMRRRCVHTELFINSL